MSNMKCPFCQQEMKRTNGTHNKVGVWQCQNSNDPDNVCIASGYLFNDDILNYIARMRKALIIAAAGLIKMTWGCDSFDAEYLLKEIKKITALEQKD